MVSLTTTGALVGKQFGKYKLLSLLAVGGTAEIYLAKVIGESGFEKYLVVKCLLNHLAEDPEFIKMFLDEARVSAGLEHSNIVQTLELAEHEGHYYLAMEYLAGLSVAQFARRARKDTPAGVLPVPIALGIVAQACEGLYYAHHKQVDGIDIQLVHRDVSPQNLIVTFEGVLKIVDFGIAKSTIRETHTEGGAIKGKFAYLAPEQCNGQKLDGRTDVFALGIICHELLTGKRLFKRSTPYASYQAIVEGNIPAPSRLNPTLPTTLDAVVLKALAYDPEERYGDANQFRDALHNLKGADIQIAGAAEISEFYENELGKTLRVHAQRMQVLLDGGSTKQLTWDSEIADDDSADPIPEVVEENSEVAAGSSQAHAVGFEDTMPIQSVSDVASVDIELPSGAWSNEAHSKPGIFLPTVTSRLTPGLNRSRLISLLVFAVCAIMGFILTLAIYKIF